MNAASSSIGAIHLQPVGKGIALEFLDELAAALARTFRVSCHVRTSTLDVRFALDAIRGQSTPESPIDAAIRTDLISHLSDIAVRTGRSSLRARAAIRVEKPYGAAASLVSGACRAAVISRCHFDSNPFMTVPFVLAP